MKLLFTGIVLFLLSACGGSSGGEDQDTFDPATTISGNLVVPDQESILTINLLSPLAVANINCDAVPAGYTPLASTQVEFIDDSNNVLSTVTTDECGFFASTEVNGATQLKATSADYRDLIADINTFKSNGSKIASTIPANADYQIAAIQFAGESGDSVAFTVSDTLSRKAVIGIPQSAITISQNDTPVTLTDLSIAADSADPASVSLVLDASSSMSSSVLDLNGEILRDANDIAYTRYRATALASHFYLDNMPSTDETAIVVFSSRVYPMNDAVIAERFDIRDSNGDMTSYTFSEDGFTSSAEDLRFVVDAYNRDSQLYDSFRPDQRHPDTPDVSILSYRLGGTTALYDGILQALDITSARASNRKIVIAMSDGGNNAGTSNPQTVIDSGIAKGIPVYTIAFGGADSVAMENIATQTNASNFTIEDVDLAGVFQTIQTGITFQYVGTYQANVTSGDIIKVELSFNGLTTDRSITR